MTRHDACGTSAASPEEAVGGRLLAAQHALGAVLGQLSCAPPEEKPTSDKKPTDPAPTVRPAGAVISVVPVVKIEQVEPAPRWVNVPVVIRRS